MGDLPNDPVPHLAERAASVIAPLDDPHYEPKHPPINGRIPDVVARWGRASQLRWFRRCGGQLDRGQDLSGYWVSSPHHIGPCCGSCENEYEFGTGVMVDGWCCCRDSRAQRDSAAATYELVES